MIDMLGVIYDSDNDVDMKDIIWKRSLAAVPFGGRYRLVDFILSNMVNSEMVNIGIITKNHYNSLMTHLNSGKEWDLNRKREGLYIFPPYGGHDESGWFKGSTDAIHSIMGFIRKCPQKYVLISGSNMVCNMTFNDALDFHIQKKADVTVLYKELDCDSKEELKRNTVIQTDEDGRINDMAYKSSMPSSNKLSMGMYIVEKSLLEYLVEECIARGKNDLVRDILIEKIKAINVYGYEFNGYLGCIDSIYSYYKYSMMLLNQDTKNELFYKSGHIYTKVRDEVPAKYADTALIENSIVADGCVIEGKVENCVLFRGVKIGQGARISNSIIMEGTEIYENAVLGNVIIDKDVVIRKGKRLTGQENYPVVVRKGVVI